MVWEKQMTRRDLISRVGKYSVAGGMLYLLAACNNNDGLTVEEIDELRLLLGSHMGYVVDLNANFEDSHGVNLNTEYVTTPDLQNTLTSSFVARDSPWDIAFVTAEIAAELRNNDWIVNLTERLGTDREHTIVEGALEAGEVDGELVAMPITIGCPILMWNKQMMEDAGLDPEAPEQWHSTPNSWDTMVEYAIEMTKQENGTQYYGLVDAWAGDHSIWTFGALIQMHGGDLMDEDGNPVMNSEEGIESLQKMVDLLHKHECLDPASLTYTWVEDASPGFLNGTRGMIMTWPFMVSVAQHSEDSQIQGQVGFAPNPSVATSASVDGSEFLAIPAFSDREDAAWEFIEEVTSYENQREQGLNSDWMPIYEELLEDPAIVEVHPTAPVVKQAYTYPTRGYRSADYNRWVEILTSQITEALEQNKSPEEALNDAVEEIERSRS